MIVVVGIFRVRPFVIVVFESVPTLAHTTLLGRCDGNTPKAITHCLFTHYHVVLSNGWGALVGCK